MESPALTDAPVPDGVSERFQDAILNSVDRQVARFKEVIGAFRSFFPIVASVICVFTESNWQMKPEMSCYSRNALVRILVLNWLVSMHSCVNETLPPRGPSRT
jgi:hypothetical protein